MLNECDQQSNWSLSWHLCENRYSLQVNFVIVFKPFDWIMCFGKLIKFSSRVHILLVLCIVQLNPSDSWGPVATIEISLQDAQDGVWISKYGCTSSALYRCLWVWSMILLSVSVSHASNIESLKGWPSKQHHKERYIILKFLTFLFFPNLDYIHLVMICWSSLSKPLGAGTIR